MGFVPVELREDVNRRRVVPAAATEHLNVHAGRSVNVSPLDPVLLGFQAPQRLRGLFLLLRARRLPARGVTSGRHWPETLENSPVERRIMIAATWDRRSSSSAFNNQQRAEPHMEAIHANNPAAC